MVDATMQQETRVVEAAPSRFGYASDNHDTMEIINKAAGGDLDVIGNRAAALNGFFGTNGS